MIMMIKLRSFYFEFIIFQDSFFDKYILSLSSYSCTFILQTLCFYSDSFISLPQYHVLLYHDWWIALITTKEMWSFINDYCHKKCIILCLKLWWPLLAKLLISGSVSKVILKERKISDLTVYNMISFVNINFCAIVCRWISLTAARSKGSDNFSQGGINSFWSSTYRIK